MMRHSLRISIRDFLLLTSVILWASVLSADIRVQVRDGNGVPLPGATVTLELGGGVTKTRISSSDGKALFRTLTSGAFIVRAERSGYTFQQSTGTLTSSSQQLNLTMTGASPTVTLSGTVKNSLGEPLETASITFNNNQSVTINQATGAFSVTAPMGSEYSLRVSERDHVFISPELKGRVTGSTTVRFIGYPK